ncbi:MAG TPA: hypothetical protein VGB73_11740 [Pyrinomonadaceae bacterium]|jgi:hypothetical protein
MKRSPLLVLFINAVLSVSLSAQSSGGASQGQAGARERGKIESAGKEKARKRREKAAARQSAKSSAQAKRRGVQKERGKLAVKSKARETNGRKEKESGKRRALVAGKTGGSQREKGEGAQRENQKVASARKDKQRVAASSQKETKRVERPRLAGSVEGRERPRSLRELTQGEEYARQPPAPTPESAPHTSPKNVPLSIQPYESAFMGPEEWDAPGTWSFSRGLELRGAGVGLLRQEVAGRYADLQIISNVELAEGHAVAFVVRALDKRNYYLIRITGPKAAYTPNKLRVFAVRDGEAKPFGSPLSLAGFDLRGQFALTLQLTGNRFEFRLDDTTGMREEDKPVGVVYDPENTYAAGAVGLAAGDAEQARILRFYVSPAQSVSQRLQEK